MNISIVVMGATLLLSTLRHFAQGAEFKTISDNHSDNNSDAQLVSGTYLPSYAIQPSQKQIFQENIYRIGLLGHLLSDAPACFKYRISTIQEWRGFVEKYTPTELLELQAAIDEKMPQEPSLEKVDLKRILAISYDLQGNHPQAQSALIEAAGMTRKLSTEAQHQVPNDFEQAFKDLKQKARSANKVA